MPVCIKAHVYFPSKSFATISLPSKLAAKDLRDIALSHFNVPENKRYLFGLVYTNSKGDECWLHEDKIVASYSKIPQTFNSIKLFLRVLRYPHPLVTSVAHSGTQSALRWQTWHDLTNGNLRCDSKTFYLLAARHMLLLEENKSRSLSAFLDHLDNNPLLTIPNWLTETRETILDGVKQCVQEVWPDPENELLISYLSIVERLPLYGSHIFPTKSCLTSESLTIAINSFGISIFYCSYERLAKNSMMLFHNPLDSLNIAWCDVNAKSMNDNHRRVDITYYWKNESSKLFSANKKITRKTSIEFLNRQYLKQFLYLVNILMRPAIIEEPLPLTPESIATTTTTATATTTATPITINVTTSNSVDSGFHDNFRTRSRSFGLADHLKMVFNLNNNHHHHHHHKKNEKLSIRNSMRQHSNPMLCPPLLDKSDSQWSFDSVSSHSTSSRSNGVVSYLANKMLTRTATTTTTSATTGTTTTSSQSTTPRAELYHKKQQLEQEIALLTVKLQELNLHEQKILHGRRVSSSSSQITCNINNSSSVNNNNSNNNNINNHTNSQSTVTSSDMSSSDYGMSQASSSSLSDLSERKIYLKPAVSSSPFPLQNNTLPVKLLRGRVAVPHSTAETRQISLIGQQQQQAQQYGSSHCLPITRLAAYSTSSRKQHH